jgi:hypothetical protein
MQEGNVFTNVSNINATQYQEMSQMNILYDSGAGECPRLKIGEIALNHKDSQDHSS